MRPEHLSQWPAALTDAGKAARSQGEAPLTDALDQAQRDLDEALAAVGAALQRASEAHARLRAASRASAETIDPMSDLMPATKAASSVQRDKSTLTAWCRRNQINGEKGFAIKLGGRWYVSASRFKTHLAARGRAFSRV